ncbi:MAG: phosphoribosylanthranilate isomerase [Novosphingobium sp.]|uniref:phosphoribosylanthranilate isomerase n=1 Tax=Novosphingobium sp. TaxID=1874826 RepID=UPI003C7B9B1A
MPAPKIKLCGLNDAAAIDAAVAARADYLGFNFYPPSPRYVGLEAAHQLGKQAAGQIVRVGVFVNASDATIREAVDAAGLEVIQLHGSETPQDAARLRNLLHREVWKVLSVSSAADVTRADAFQDAADLILFDAKTPKGTLPGGMGLRFDWQLLSAYRGAVRWGLAGGLTPDNVGEAARRTGAPLVDTASGIESAPGVKDPALIAAFCAAARAG